MNAPVSVHPTDETLASYGLGKLNDTVADSVNSHLAACEPCRSRVAQLSSDSFLGTLRNVHALASEKGPPASTLGPTATGPGPNEIAPHSATGAPAVPAELEQLSQYSIIRELGRGGMGIVYLAHNKLMNRPEVLKVLNREILSRSGMSERFIREIQIAARLQAPNIVTAYSAQMVGEMLVLAMEYVEGTDFAKLIRERGPMPVANAAYCAYQAAIGLQHAHERGMIHRDIKPANLILQRRGKKAVVKILDFGLAKVYSEEATEGALTHTAQMLGTPDYIAPEQSLDAQSADIRADIYSLGCTLYHMLAGHPPFKGKSVFDVLTRHQTETPSSLNLLRPEVPAELAAVVSKMMAKSPDRRYQTPSEVAQALRPYFVRTGEPGIPPKLSVSNHGPRPTSSGTARSEDRWQSLAGVSAEQKSAADLGGRWSSPQWLRSRPLLAGMAAVLVSLVFSLWLAGVFTVKTKDGMLVFKNLPADADVLVDGSTVTLTTPSSTEPISVSLQPGTYFVEVRRGDTKVTGKRVTLASGGQEEIVVELQPLPTSPPQITDRPPAKEPPVEDAPVVGSTAVPVPVVAPPSGEDTARAGDEQREKAPRNSDGFVPLLSGKDISGWQQLENNGSSWSVTEEGHLRGQGSGIVGGRPILVSDRRDFRNFRLRFQFLRTDDDYRGFFVRRTREDDLTSGYRISLGSRIKTDSHDNPLGSITKMFVNPRVENCDFKADEIDVPFGEWCQWEITAIDNRISVVVNGKQVTDYVDQENSYPSGGFALGCFYKSTFEIKDLQIEELPDSPSELPPRSEEFNLALASYHKRLEAAKEKLIAEFDRNIDKHRADAAANMIVALERQKASFLKRGFQPSCAPMRRATESYRAELRLAEDQIDGAYTREIESAGANQTAVNSLESERTQLLAPRLIAVWHNVDRIQKWGLFLFSNGKVQQVDGSNTWTLDGDQLHCTVYSSNSRTGVFHFQSTISEDGLRCEGDNGQNVRYTGERID